MSEIDANKIEELRGLMQQDAWGDVPFSGYVLRSEVRPALPALLDAILAVIEQYRAILPGLAAAAAIEIGVIARDAK